MLSNFTCRQPNEDLDLVLHWVAWRLLAMPYIGIENVQ